MIKTNYSSITKTYLAKSILLLIVIGFGNYHYSNAQGSFEEVFKITDKISLEDPIGLMPTSITTDKDGNFVTTDIRTHKVSIYNPEGNLLFNYGREGKGPGDFMNPIYTIRLSNGRLLTAEVQGKLSLFNSTGDSLIKIYNNQVMPLTEIHEIDKNNILLVGRKMIGREFKYLHIFDLKSGTTQKSFFDPRFSLREDYGGVLTTNFNLTSATVSEDKIASVFAPFSKIYLFDKDGILQDSVQLSLNHFQEIENIGSTSLSPQRFNKYLTTYSRINKIFWLDDDTFLIGYYRYTEFSREERIKEHQYSLANVNPDGTVIFDIEETPKVKSVYNAKIFFENPDFESKEQLLVGSIRN